VREEESQGCCWGYSNRFCLFDVLRMLFGVLQVEQDLCCRLSLACFQSSLYRFCEERALWTTEV
jgi:hypothetical protein